MAVLGFDAGGCAIGPVEYDGTIYLVAGYVECLGGGVDDMVDGLHGEVEGHELDNWLQIVKGSADTKIGKAMLCDWRIDYVVGVEFLKQFACDLVGVLVFGDFLAHDEDGFVVAYFLGHGIV